jgi:hypothetical protein
MIDDTGKIEKFLPLIFRLDKDTVYDVKIDKHREKRSLNANAYLWKLVTEIGNILNKSKEEVYLQMLIDYGQSEMVSILSEIDVKGYFKYYKLAGTSILNGKEFNHYKIYKGSSEYDTKEMSILLNGVVQEAKNLGIKTKEDYELEKLIEEWER